MILHVPWVLCWYINISVITFCVYAWDKHRARVSAWRVKERTLHILELLGGWPGAFLAQRQFHHKWKKTAFMRVFWGVVTVHVLFWGMYLYCRYSR